MKVTIVIGEICSGKTTFSSSFSEADRIDVGSIVRELTATEERTFDKDLDVQIAERLIQDIAQHGGDQLVIVGLRQISILVKVEDYCEQKGIDLDIVYLEVPRHIRERRYEERGDVKDVRMAFDLADKKDSELGLFSLIHYIKHRTVTKIIKNY